MYSTFLTVALFFTLAINAVFAEFAVSNPQINACDDGSAKVTWQATSSPPYSLLIVAADDPCGDALVDAGEYQTTYATVKTKGLKAGQKIQVSLEDADGEEGWSDVLTVGSCPSGSSSSSGDDSVTGTTLVVTPTITDIYGSSSPSIAPVGAANAANPFGDKGAATVSRHLSIPALILTAIAGVVALL